MDNTKDKSQPVKPAGRRREGHPVVKFASSPPKKTRIMQTENLTGKAVVKTALLLPIRLQFDRATTIRRHSLRPYALRLK